MAGVLALLDLESVQKLNFLFNHHSLVFSHSHLVFCLPHTWVLSLVLSLLFLLGGSFHYGALETGRWGLSLTLMKDRWRIMTHLDPQIKYFPLLFFLPSESRPRLLAPWGIRCETLAFVFPNQQASPFSPGTNLLKHGINFHCFKKWWYGECLGNYSCLGENGLSRWWFFFIMRAEWNLILHRHMLHLYLLTIRQPPSVLTLYSPSASAES